MLPADNSPNPLGDSFNDATVSFDWGVVPVNVLGTSQPLRVVIVGRETGANPLGESPRTNALANEDKMKSIFDRMPRAMDGVFSSNSRKWGQAVEKAFGKGQFGEAGKGAAGAAGVAAGGVVMALEKAKEVFVDPLLDAAKSGFQMGVNRGMGLETVGKSFEVLGVTFGTMFLASTIRFSASVLEFAESVNRYSGEIKSVGDYLGGALTEAANPFAKITHFGDWLDRRLMNNFASEEDRNNWQEKYKDRTTMGVGMDMLANSLGITGLKDFARMTLGYGPTGDGSGGKTDELVSLLAKRMKNSLGPQASYSGIADVREQAQLAALNQDPLEAKIMKLFTEKLDKIIEETSKTAENTKPT